MPTKPMAATGSCDLFSDPFSGHIIGRRFPPPDTPFRIRLLGGKQILETTSDWDGMGLGSFSRKQDCWTRYATGRKLRAITSIDALKPTSRRGANPNSVFAFSFEAPRNCVA